MVAMGDGMSAMPPGDDCSHGYRDQPDQDTDQASCPFAWQGCGTSASVLVPTIVASPLLARGNLVPPSVELSPSLLLVASIFRPPKL